MSTLETSNPSVTETQRNFLKQAEVELKRAERYRVFVSLVVLDISAIERLDDPERLAVADQVESLVRASLRGCDYYSICGRG
ncbi:MAG: hypothetical protein HY851_09465, partial [candidate division Zixibacteria bacterium]|nr:hypothetical protein [candidate division Zixibacteria bacterium]